MLLQVLNDPSTLLGWKELLLIVFALVESVVRLTPSENDNSVWNKVSNILTLILNAVVPNRKKGGGRFGKK